MNPQFLPGGEAVLFTIVDDNGVAMGVALVDLETGEQTVLLAEVGAPAFPATLKRVFHSQDLLSVLVPGVLNSVEVRQRDEVDESLDAVAYASARSRLFSQRSSRVLF